MVNKTVIRGDVWTVELPSIGGSVQGGFRPVVIISNNINNDKAPTVNIVPISTAINKKDFPIHAFITKGDGGLNSDSIVLLEQTMTVQKTSLKNHLGHLSDKSMKLVDNCIKIQLGL